VRFIVLVLIQVLILNNIRVQAFLIPHIYLLFILLLPFETPKWALLLSAFFIGLTVDLFSYTVGLHTIACTLIAFLRPLFIRMIASRQQYEPGIQPGITGLGFRWFLYYSLMMTAAHHLAIYFLEEFRFTDFFTVIFRVAVNVAISTMVIIFTLLLISRHKGRSAN
jgi:hypothetical protein